MKKETTVLAIDPPLDVNNKPPDKKHVSFLEESHSSLSPCATVHKFHFTMFIRFAGYIALLFLILIMILSNLTGKPLAPEQADHVYRATKVINSVLLLPLSGNSTT